MDSIEPADAMVSFRSARKKLPIQIESLAQLGRGNFEAEAFVLPGSDVWVYYSDVCMHLSTFADLDSNYTGIVLPLSWRDKFVINGEDVHMKAIYAPVDNTLFETFGGERKTAAIATSRQALTATVSALRGTDPDDVRICSGAIEVPPVVLKSARRQLVEICARYRDAYQEEGLSHKAVMEITHKALEIVCSVYSCASSVEIRKSRNGDRLGSTVRKAEERFAAAQGDAVSLADLCAAAGVSQVTLYHSFNTMCGCSPMEYFKKRRLVNARLELLGRSPARGAIKQAALNAGLTHLGRFSAEYRALFDELPSTTLHRRPY